MILRSHLFFVRVQKVDAKLGIITIFQNRRGTVVFAELCYMKQCVLQERIFSLNIVFSVYNAINCGQSNVLVQNNFPALLFACKLQSSASNVFPALQNCNKAFHFSSIFKKHKKLMVVGTVLTLNKWLIFSQPQTARAYTTGILLSC